MDTFCQLCANFTPKNLKENMGNNRCRAKKYEKSNWNVDKKFLKGKKVGEEKTLDFSDTKFIELLVFCGVTNFFGALPKKTTPI